MPVCRDSRSSITSATVLPLASTDFSPPVWVRRMVGMDTVLPWGCSRSVGRDAVDDCATNRRP